MRVSQKPRIMINWVLWMWGPMGMGGGVEIPNLSSSLSTFMKQLCEFLEICFSSTHLCFLNKIKSKDLIIYMESFNSNVCSCMK